eukprot:3789296-Pyramimonas_sp.AAC.1
MAWPAAAALLLSGVMEISEGVLLIGSKADNVFLLRSMAVTILLLNAMLYVSGRLSWGLAGVWWGLAAFYMMRGVQPLAHLARHMMPPNPPTQAKGLGNAAASA